MSLIYESKNIVSLLEKLLEKNELDIKELELVKNQINMINSEIQELEILKNRFRKVETTLLKMNKPDKFTDDSLIYSATARCPCGAGLAYVKHSHAYNMHYWDCSAILKCEADINIPHTAQLPFACYEIKSENQNSAWGMSTRPNKNI